MNDRHETSRRVAVIGAGYVGLPTAAALASFGHRVVCAESDPRRLGMLERGEMPIVEPGLGDMVAEQRAQGRLVFVASAAEAASSADFVFLCVPTPQGPDGSADLSFVEAAATAIAPCLSPGTVVVNKSTVPVGTATLVARVTGRPDVAVVSNPEFLREGRAVADSLAPDRIVVGGDDRSAALAVGELFARTRAPLIVTDTATAEAIKYAANAFLATKLSFANATAALCEAVGADVRDVILGLGYDHRIGFDFLRPGPGWGGSCLPKDTAALLSIARDAGYEFPLLQAVVASNDAQLDSVVAKVAESLGRPPSGARVGIWGLTFKAGTDDRRSSPAVDLARRLVSAGATVAAYDPTVAPAPRSAAPADLDGVECCADPYEAVRDAESLLIATEWDEFRRLDFEKVGGLMARRAVVDARNLLDPASLRRLGFTYRGIGRR